MKKLIPFLLSLLFASPVLAWETTHHQDYGQWHKIALEDTKVQILNLSPYCHVLQVGAEEWKRCDVLVFPPSYAGEIKKQEYTRQRTMDACACWWRYEHWDSTYNPATGPYFIQDTPWPLAEVVSINGDPWCKIGRVLIPESYPGRMLQNALDSKSSYRLRPTGK